MRIISRIAVVIILLGVMLMPSLTGHAAYAEGKMDPESIDIYDAASGEFLDIDLTEYRETAWQAYQDGDWETAAKYYIALLQYDISDGGNIYNLACCFGLLGEADLAAQYLMRAYNMGFDDVEHMMWDPDFEPVRGAQVFDDAVAELQAIAAEENAGGGGVTYTMSNDLMPCNVQTPEDFDPEETYTLVLGLHGYGSSPDRFIRLWERFDNPGFIYAAPRAPYTFSTGSDLGYSWNNRDENSPELWPRTMRTTEQYVMHVVENLKGQYNIDKVYLLGFSQGCMMTYVVGINNPEMFDGLICFGGWVDNEWICEDAIMAASGLDVFIAHGNEDRMVEFVSGVEAYESLQGYGYDVTFYEFDGGHAVPEEALLRVQQWLSGL